LKVLPLKKRGIETSRLVLGCMPFGGEWTRDPITGQNIKDAEAAIDAALSININMLDTANVYRWGKSESIIGTILKNKSSLRQQLIIQSKCGIRPGDNGLPSRFDFSKEHILEAVDASLKRLGLDYMDILLLHRPDPLMEPDEVAEAFGKLKASGKVRYFGVSNMNVSQIKFLQSALPDELAVNQLELSLSHLDWLDQTIHVNQKAGLNVHFGEGLLEYCQLENIQIQAWGPLSQGLFSGRNVEDRPETVQNTAKLVKQMAEAKETTPEAIVLAWLMKHPAAIQPVIGSIKPDRIKACQDAEKQSEQMSREEWYSLYQSARGKPMP
jgi:predicted oxidoreductase